MFFHFNLYYWGWLNFIHLLVLEVHVLFNLFEFAVLHLFDIFILDMGYDLFGFLDDLLFGLLDDELFVFLFRGHWQYSTHRSTLGGSGRLGCRHDYVRGYTLLRYEGSRRQGDAVCRRRGDRGRFV